MVPQPDPIEISIAYGVALQSQGLAEAINELIIFASNTGEIDRSYEYWILGQGAKDHSPRWSIIRDVLGWVE